MPVYMLGWNFSNTLYISKFSFITKKKKKNIDNERLVYRIMLCFTFLAYLS